MPQPGSRVFAVVPGLRNSVLPEAIAWRLLSILYQVHGLIPQVYIFHLSESMGTEIELEPPALWNPAAQAHRICYPLFLHPQSPRCSYWWNLCLLCSNCQAKVRDLEEKCRTQSEQFNLLSRELERFRQQAGKIDLLSSNSLVVSDIPGSPSKSLSQLMNGIATSLGKGKTECFGQGCTWVKHSFKQCIVVFLRTPRVMLKLSKTDFFSEFFEIHHIN